MSFRNFPPLSGRIRSQQFTQRKLASIPNYFQMPSIVDEIVEQEEEEDDPCIGKRCTANEHCCEGHVCVDTEDETNDVCKS